MRTTKKTVAIAVMFCIGSVPVCLASADAVVSGRELLRAVRQRDSRRERPVRRERGAYRTAKTGRRSGDGNHPTAMELLDKYAETQAKLQSIIVKSETSDETLYLNLGKPQRSRMWFSEEFRCDGEPKYLRKYTWGNLLGRRIPKADTIKEHFWWDGRNYITYRGSALKIFTSLESLPQLVRGLMGRSYLGKELMAYFWGDDEPVDSILRRSRSISVREVLERIGGSPCYVVDAVGESGNYTLWIDPEHGYNIAKAESSKKEGDLFGDRRLAKGKGSQSSMQNVRFKRIEGVWAPMEANVEYSAIDYCEVKKHIKRTQVIIDPDHEALRSFSLDEVPSGHDFRGLDYFFGGPPERDGGPDLGFEEDAFEFRWVPKAKFVANENCRVVRNDPDNRHLLPIVKVLPRFGDFVRDYNLDPAPSEAKGKHIVLCFWDINQQQSCELLLGLRDRKEALAKNGVAIIAIETSGAQTDKVHSWAKENKLGFPVGAFYGRFERYLIDKRNDLDPGEKMDLDDRKKKTILSNLVTDLKTIWTVEKLPWLILTDRDLVVTAEGFSLDELDDILSDEVPFEKPTSKPPSLSGPSKGATTSSKLLPNGLQEGLILYYSFDEDEGEKVTDLSGNGNHGRVHGAKRTRDEKGGGAVDFDGGHGYISVEDIALKEYTFSAWLRISKGRDNRYIFILDDWVHCHGMTTNSRGGVSIGADSEGINEYDQPFAANTWEHLLLTHRSGVFKLYKDGKLIKEGRLESSPVTDTLYLGGKEKDPDHSWPGMMDDVAVFNRALTKEEVKLLYKNTKHNR